METIENRKKIEEILEALNRLSAELPDMPFSGLIETVYSNGHLENALAVSNDSFLEAINKTVLDVQAENLGLI